MAHVELPAPWEHLQWGRHDQLESIAGTGLTRDDLVDDDFEDHGGVREVASPRAHALTAHTWARIRNEETSVEVWVRLQRAPGTNTPYTVNAVVYPFELGRDLTGADLRTLPLQSIATAYSRYATDRFSGQILRRLLEGQELRPPLEPLPPSNRSDVWLALVTQQYLALEALDDGESVARAMARINDVPLRTAQSWVTRARRKGFLPPAAPKAG